MSVLLIIVVIFIGMEFCNVLALYFKPGTKMFNSIGVFNAWEKSKEDPEIHDFVKYLVYWVAGTKLIFIALTIVIFIIGNLLTQCFAALALFISISTFYWKLYPLIKKMDKGDQIDPKGYSRVLFFMIMGMMINIFIGFLFSIFDIYS